MQTLIIITGPTASGKTALAIDIARRHHTPVISADSRQIYRQLPIGTAQPTPAQQAAAPHLLVATHDIDQPYSAADYERHALQAIADQGPVALLCGGTQMYIDAVTRGIDDIPTIRPDIRADVNDTPLPQLLEELRQRDPEHYRIVDRNNPRRVRHAVEICRQTGDTYTILRTGQRKPRPFRTLKIALNPPRDELYRRINQRVLDMFRQGLEDEARAVYQYRHLPALHTIGYRELFRYFDGDITRDEAIRQIQSHTREYARKQLTWLRRDPTVHWLAV